MARSPEGRFQDGVIDDLNERFPGCLTFKLYKQGFPDLLVLHNNKWAALECKSYRKAKRQPNQEYWVDIMNEMSFSAFVSPENKKEVLDELEQTFRV